MDDNLNSLNEHCKEASNCRASPFFLQLVCSSPLVFHLAFSFGYNFYCVYVTICCSMLRNASKANVVVGISSS